MTFTCSALTVSESAVWMRSSALISTSAPRIGLRRFDSWTTSWSSGSAWPPSVRSATRLSPENCGARLPGTHFAAAVEFAAPTPSVAPAAPSRRLRSSTRPSARIAWSIARPRSGVMLVLALPVTAPRKLGSIPSWVGVLPAPVSLSTHCARSGLAPLAVLMLPLATIGSTRFCPATETMAALPRHCQTGGREGRRRRSCDEHPDAGCEHYEKPAGHASPIVAAGRQAPTPRPPMSASLRHLPVVATK